MLEKWVSAVEKYDKLINNHVEQNWVFMNNST